VLVQVNSALDDMRNGQGTLGKLLKDPQAYSDLLALLQQGKGTMVSFQQDADALKSMPIVRNYVEDPEALLVRPACERNRQYFAEADLFEPGRAVLTADGKRRLDELAPWLAGLKHKGSEVVVVSYADPKDSSSAVARTLTKKQSEAVRDYLKSQHSIQKMVGSPRARWKPSASARTRRPSRRKSRSHPRALKFSFSCRKVKSRFVMSKKLPAKDAELVAPDHGPRTRLIYHFCRMQLPSVRLAPARFEDHLRRTFTVYRAKADGKASWTITWVIFTRSIGSSPVPASREM